MAEVFFSIITRQAIRRGSFTSVKDLIAAIEAFIDGWNDRCHPFTWTKTADEILPKCRPGKRTSFTRHYRYTCWRVARQPRESRPVPAGLLRSRPRLRNLAAHAWSFTAVPAVAGSRVGDAGR
jgi:hypothetical protein